MMPVPRWAKAETRGPKTGGPNGLPLLSMRLRQMAVGSDAGSEWARRRRVRISFHSCSHRARVVNGPRLIPANNYEGISRPAVTFLALANPLPVRNYGPLFDNADESGIITVEPPQAGAREYAVLVPQVDADGNDLAGRLSTTVLAPLGTYTGWNLGRADRWPNHLCSLQGSFIPFARTRAERLATGDPRLSLEERYGSHEGYVAAVRAAAARLVQQRLLLPADAERLNSEAEASDVLR